MSKKYSEIWGWKISILNYNKIVILVFKNQIIFGQYEKYKIKILWIMKFKMKIKN